MLTKVKVFYIKVCRCKKFDYLYSVEIIHSLKKQVMSSQETKNLEIAKDCQSVINAYGPSLSDATEDMRIEYRQAVKDLRAAGYRMEMGRLIKFVTV